MPGRWKKGKCQYQHHDPSFGGQDLLIASNHAASASDEESKRKCKYEEAFAVDVFALLGPYAASGQSSRLASNRDL